MIDALFRGEIDVAGQPILHCPACNLGLVGYEAVTDHVERVHPDYDPNVKLSSDLVRMAVLTGMLDNDLDTIQHVVRARKKQVAETAALQLQPGQLFYIKDGSISPKLLGGALVRFDRHDGDWLVCNLRETVNGKWRLGMTVRLRHSHVGAFSDAVI